MATFRAIEAVCQSVVDLLRDNYDPADFSQDLEFRASGLTNLGQHMTAGVTLFLYRVMINGTHRIPPGRVAPDGSRGPTQLPVDLHFLLTPWGKDATTQNSIAGWVMRTIEDTPVLPAGLLNRRSPGVFHPDETVELVIGEIATEDLFHLWELIGPNSYRLSIPYLARNVWIESGRTEEPGDLVQERILHVRTSAVDDVAAGVPR